MANDNTLFKYTPTRARPEEIIMKNGKCTKCGASDVQKFPYTNTNRNHLHTTGFSRVKMNEYVCCGCGLIETYLADMNDVDKIKKKCTKVETKE